MRRYIRNSGKSWTNTDIKNLKNLARENTPTRVIGLKLGRTAEAVRSKACTVGVTLLSTNRSPSGRRRK